MSDLPTAVLALATEADEMELAAKVASQNGMFESGAILRSKAAGIRRAIEILAKLEDEQNAADIRRANEILTKLEDEKII